MTALVAMLVVAIVPTIRMTAFLVSIDRRGLERLAVCYFPDYGLPLEASDGTQESVLISIIFSICLVCFSFASRLVRLQPGASSRVGRLRAWCGGMMRRSLVKKKYSEQRGVLYTLLITRPCIAVWLVCRVYVDLFSSAMVEVGPPKHNPEHLAPFVSPLTDYSPLPADILGLCDGSLGRFQVDRYPLIWSRKRK